MTRRFLPALLLVAVALDSGCIARKLKITRHGAPPNAQLATATLEDLEARLKTWDQQIHTINANVDLEPSTGSVNKGEIEQYKDIRGFVLIRKPAMFRMIGLLPVVGTRVFDMVSDGIGFKIHFPTENKMVVGQNQMDRPSTKKYENIRPQHLFDALVVQPIGTGERAVLENHTDEEEASYIVHVIRGTGTNIKLVRNLWFERGELRLTRQIVFDAQGDILTDARYEDYKFAHGVSFPHSIYVSRPKDEYGIRMTVKKLELNHELDDEKFALATPKGAEIIDLQKKPGDN